MNEPKTYGEAKSAGWIETDSTWTRGYMSRKFNTEDSPIQEAGGSRSGQFFVLLPSWGSTKYCIRQYIRAPKN